MTAEEKRIMVEKHFIWLLRREYGGNIGIHGI